MRIGFVINDLATEHHEYTTVRLAMTAANAGHEVWIIGVADFAYDPDERVHARARGPRAKEHKTSKAFLSALRGEKARIERITISDLDVLLPRNDPAADAERPWAQPAGIVFGELAARHGVIVLNDPTSLADAFNKMYFQHFPEQVRPRTLITRDPEEVRAFVEKEKWRAVLKPLQGSGGTNVFIVKPGEEPNLSQMIEAITRDGYVVAQEYLPQAKKGDVRLFLMNGEPLQRGGKYAAFKRITAKGQGRSNMHAGGRAARAIITDEMLRIAEIIRPKLLADGMFLVGVDLVGDKLMEINVFTPGGIFSASKLEGENFAQTILKAIEKKVEYRRLYPDIDNITVATM